MGLGSGWRRCGVLRIGLLAGLVALFGCGIRTYAGYTVVFVASGPDFEQRLRDAFIDARPGTTIEIDEGTFDLTDELVLNTSHVRVRGQGMDKTVLRFGQSAGAQGIVVAADEFAVEDLAIEDTPGDGIKVEGADGVVFKRVRVEWTRGPHPGNGSYGLYPVQSRNVIVVGCVVKGASDAGIYVGQSEKILVEANRVEWNVAGIEIENSKHADVHANVATHNTAGILVFDLPYLQYQGGQSVRVYENTIVDNNTENFARPGNLLQLAPSGSGVIVMANDDVEIFDNQIGDHDTGNIAIVSYAVTFNSVSDPRYDAFPERIHVHDNAMWNGGANPRGDLGLFVSLVFAPDAIPDLVWDGNVDPAKLVGGVLPDALRICIHDNSDPSDQTPTTFGNFNMFRPPSSTDPSPHACVHRPLYGVVFDAPAPLPPPDPQYSDEEIAALCDAPGSGVNWDAFVVNCPRLSSYRLFAGGDPRRNPNAGGTPFDLTTPLFSDYAHKARFAFVRPGAAVNYRPDEPLNFPIGTILSKTFSFRFDLRDPALGEEMVETRLLIRRNGGWVGLPYIWNEDESEAFLALDGGDRPVAWTHTDGSARQTLYQIPSTTQCGRCHVGDFGAEPIGPKARLLNRPLAYPGGDENQLDRWSRVGLLVGAPPSAQAPRLPVWDDPADGTLEARARAYLESNCAHCHSPEGRARQSGLFLEAGSTLDASYGLCKPPVAAGTGTGGLLYDIVPGDPDASILVYRMSSVDPAIQMPELARSVVHEEGVLLVRQWIASLPGSCD